MPENLLTPGSPRALVLSLRTNVDAGRTAGVTGSWALRVGDLELHARVVDGTFTIEPGTPSSDADFVGTPEALASLVYGGRPLAEAIASGDVVVTGDRTAVERFLILFTAPDKVALPDP